MSPLGWIFVLSIVAGACAFLVDITSDFQASLAR